jgi:hypothetical protein
MHNAPINTIGSDMTKTELEQALLSLEALVSGFHAVKNIRAWAAEENLAIKRAALAKIAELQEKLGDEA